MLTRFTVPHLHECSIDLTNVVNGKIKPDKIVNIPNIFFKLPISIWILYFDDKYPNNEYQINIITQNPLKLKISNLKRKYNWMLYSASVTNDLLNDIKVDIFKRHLSAYKIQQWWKKLWCSSMFKRW